MRSVNQARASGLNTHRLRANDLEMYFHGTRVVRSRFPASSQLFEEAKVHELALIRALGSRLLETQFFSHRSAAMLWGWLKAALQRKPRYENPEFRRFLRAYQQRALLVGKSRATRELMGRS